MSARPPPCPGVAPGSPGSLRDALRALDSAPRSLAPAGGGRGWTGVDRLVQRATAPGSAWIAHATGPAATLAYLAAVAGRDDVELDAPPPGSDGTTREPATATFAVPEWAAALTILEDGVAQAERLALLVDRDDAGAAMRLLRNGETAAALRLARLALVRSGPGLPLVVATAPDGEVRFNVDSRASMLSRAAPPSATRRRKTLSGPRGLGLLAAALAIVASIVAVAVAHSPRSAPAAAGPPPPHDPFPPLSTSVATFDQRSGQVLLVGCCETAPGGVQRMATWESAGTGWQHLTPSLAPPWRQSPGVAPDPVTGHLLLQGGAGHHDTWTWDGVSWTELHPTGPTPDGPLTMAADPATRTLVALSQGNGPAAAGTWSWDGTAWAHLASRPPAPGPFAYDPATRRVVSLIDAPRGAPDEQTWAFDGASWAQVPTTDVVAVEFYPPSAGFSDQMAADFTGGSVVYVEQPAVKPDYVIPGTTFVWANGAWSRPPTVVPLERQGLLVTRAPAGSPLLVMPRATGARPDIWRWTGAQWTPLEPSR